MPEKKKLPVIPATKQGSNVPKWNAKKVIVYAFIAIIGVWIAAFFFAVWIEQPANREIEQSLQKASDRYTQQLVDKGVFRRKTPRSRSTKPEAGFQMPGRSSQIVTYAHYTQIRTGMTYEQVVSIIGKTGEEMSRNHIDGVPGVMNSITTVMYSWMNGNGSNMNAIFQNNNLMQKAQFGLR